MNAADDTPRLVECSTCGNVGLGTGEIRCCESPMEPLDATPSAHGESGEPFAEPELDELLRAVYGMSSAELDVCLCVMEGGTLTVAELTERVDYDRSVVARHLNHLAALGVVEKRRQILDRGGDVYVYTPESPATVRRRFRESFLRWAAAAAARIDDLSREKVEGIAESESATQWTVFRDG